MESTYITHSFAPIYDSHSRILILGTMPSPKSREVGFYYGHPRNRFWKVVSDVCGESLPETKEDKIAFALSHRIAVWDVLAGCDICKADDSSIRNPKANNMDIILSHTNIRAIFTTGISVVSKILLPEDRHQGNISALHKSCKLQNFL